MWKKLLAYLLTLLIITSFGYALYNDYIRSEGAITGIQNNGVSDSLHTGDEVHLGAASDDVYIVLGLKDDYLYLLKKNTIGSPTDYNTALNNADNYNTKANFGNVGSTHLSLSGNEVGLISKAELQNIPGLVSGNQTITGVYLGNEKWWLKDADLSANRARFVDGNNLAADSGIMQTTVSETIYNDPVKEGNCSTASTDEFGVMPITQYNAPTVAKAKYVSDARINITLDYPTIKSQHFSDAACSVATTSSESTWISKSYDFSYSLDQNGTNWVSDSSGLIARVAMVAGNWRPRVIIDSSGKTTISKKSMNMKIVGGTCYKVYVNSAAEYIDDASSYYKSTKIASSTSGTLTASASVIGDPTIVTKNCPILTNSAGSASIRPNVKIKASDLIMRNHSKRIYRTGTALSTGNIPSSDNSGEYLTIKTNTISTVLQGDVSGVSGNRYVTSKTKGSTIVSLPLSFSGPVEGNRYVSAEAIDKDGNKVYGVLKAVGNSTKDNIDIDFENLLTEGSNSFQVTLYLEDEGSKNTAYRSEGTTITVQFQINDYPLAFTNPDVTNIKIGSSDIKETIMTNNPELSLTSPNAAVYSLSGGISGTGLNVTNDSSNPKGFIISVGNTPNPSLPADFTLTAELETTNSTKSTATKQLHVFQEASSFKWLPKNSGSYNTSEVGSGVLLGYLEVQNGLPKYTYALTSPSDSGYDASKAKDNGNFTVSNTTLDIGQKAEVNTNTALLPGTYYIQCKVTDSYGDVLYTDFTIAVSANKQPFIYTDISGTQLPIGENDYLPYSEVYAPNKTFQLYTAGNPTGSAVTYKLKSGSPTDVISVDSNGLVTILNASLNNQTGKVFVQATSHDPSGNFEDKTIELPINIDKGTRIISFAENPIYVTSGKGKVTPVTEVDGSTDTDGDVLIEVDSNEDHTIAWTNDNKTIDYNYSGESGKDIKIHATKPMNRNYKAAEAGGTIHIMGLDENILAITSPGQIIYGDHFTIGSSQYDADSTNVKYTFELDKTTYISSPTVSGNSAQFDALKHSTGEKTTITVTRTADGETPLSKKVQVTVLPKPIEITIDDKEKYKGEVNPTLTYQDFRSELVTWNGVQDVIQENDIKLSTTAKTNSNAGSYPIKGDANSLNKTYPNYSFTFKEGTLTIKEENIEDDWYHLETDDGSNTAYTGSWTNQNVNIISDHSEYKNMSLDQSTWKPNKVTVYNEGETNQSFWMKKDSGAITKEKQEIIKIDKTAPKVKNIKAKDTNNKLQDIINKVTGGVFFKPRTAFEITTSDAKDNLKVSGTKELAYKVYKVETRARTTDDLFKEGTLTVTNEKAIIAISETVGMYKVCVIATDNAGNTNTESCHKVELKKIDVDVDDDDKPDFNDSDGDGCPDLNIKWKDPNDETKWIVINGDRDYDGIPDLNIDSDGDGKPNLNIDTDKDGKPDLNLVILKKSDWKPTKCVKADIDNGILEEYCTGTNVKAIINIDTDGDNIPNINIDTNGDMKADFNISKDNQTPSINIGTVHLPWEPKKDYTYQGFSYDTDTECKPYLNIDSDGDGRPDINVDLDGDGKPDINIDIDGDKIPDTNIDGDGDGNPDINIDTDGDGKPDENVKKITEWKPNKNVDGNLPYDTMEIDKLQEQKEPDKPLVTNDSNEPTNSDQQGNSTNVKGYYYPGNSIGGAITGDETDLMLHLEFMVLGIVTICYQLCRYKKDTFQ